MAKFANGDTVINIITKDKGVVCEVCPPARGRQLYRVRFHDTLETCLEQNIDGYFDIDNPFERVRKGIYGNRDQFMLVNTTHKINNSNNNTISSLKASKTLFKAYQFKPLLKFINSPSRRLLIADEVGLGKTVEAGHILLELKAREEFKSALIVCPNSLKLKWQTELKEKFGLSFQIYQSLAEAVEHLKANPQTARGILNYEKIRARTSEEGDRPIGANEYSNNLIEFLESGQRRYSIVLCDEAHKLRNHETQSHRGMAKILDYADAAVFLTATPIMLGENDLYNLLHLLDPREFDNQEVFHNLINANRPFVKAISMLNSNEPLDIIRELLVNGQVVKVHQIGDYVFKEDATVYDVYAGIPLYESILEQLRQPDSFALRAKLQNDIASLSSINNIFSRTRKREVSTDERQQTERSSHKIAVVLTPEERMLYDAVIDDYITGKGGLGYYSDSEESLPKGSILGLIQKKRMIASSVNAYQLYVDNDCDPSRFCADVAAQPYLADAKIDQLVEICTGVRKAGGMKLIVFSIFKFTVRYLAIRLKQLGFRIFTIHGDIKERESIIQEFKRCEDFCILLSTEVGSEGLDMQFCAHLVNYDLPWNPMVVEQRIGRIDRFGQLASQVHIYNLVVKDSIQELIYDRLLERIGIFQGVIGDLEMILEDMSESFTKLEKDLYGMDLSILDREKKIRDIAQAFENQKIQLEQVEEGLTNTLSNDFYFQNEISKIRNHKLYVTERELENYVSMLVSEKLKTCDFNKINKYEYTFGVPKSAPTELTNFLIANQPLGSDTDDLFRIYRQNILPALHETNHITLTFDQKYAFENKSADYVNIYNPIIIAASNYFKKAISEVGRTFELAYDVPPALNLAKGLYYLAVYIVSTSREVMGKSVSSDVLIPVIYNVADDVTITDEELNLKVFGDIQDTATFLLEPTDTVLSPEAVANMESDFTEFISNYVLRKKEDIRIKDESLKAIRRRQLEEYYSTRIAKEEDYILNEQNNIGWLPPDDPETARAKNRLQLANNRLRMLQASKQAAEERLNSAPTPTLSYSLISLSKVIMN